MSNNKKYWKNLAELNSANNDVFDDLQNKDCLLYTSPSPRDKRQARMPSSA